MSLALVRLALAMLATGAGAHAQEEVQEREGLRFSFGPPGARPLGMGGAFVAVADDATAAVSNPAGLVILEKPEVSGQFRYQSQDISIPYYSPAFTLTGQSTTFRPSFLSVVLPRGKVAFGLFYHETAEYDFDGTHEVSPYSYYNSGSGAPGTYYRAAEQERRSIRNFGGSVALRAGTRVALGLSVQVADVSANHRYQQERVYEGSSNYYYFVDGYEWVVDDTALGLRGGVLFNPNGRFSIGLNASWLEEQDESSHEWKCGTYQRNSVPPPCTPTDRALDLDKSGGVIAGSAGVAFRPNSQWVLALDVLGYEVSGSGTFGPDNSALSLRGGLEYTFLTKGVPVSLRAGAYSDQADAWDESELFGTAGLGVVLNKKVQLDLAVGLSGSTTQVIGSVVARF